VTGALFCGRGAGRGRWTMAEKGGRNELRIARPLYAQQSRSMPYSWPVPYLGGQSRLWLGARRQQPDKPFRAFAGASRPAPMAERPWVSESKADSGERAEDTLAVDNSPTPGRARARPRRLRACERDVLGTGVLAFGELRATTAAGLESTHHCRLDRGRRRRNWALTPHGARHPRHHRRGLQPRVEHRLRYGHHTAPQHAWVDNFIEVGARFGVNGDLSSTSTFLKRARRRRRHARHRRLDLGRGYWSTWGEHECCVVSNCPQHQQTVATLRTP